MLTVYCSYLFLSLYLLSITQLTNAASLRFSSKWPLDRRLPSSVVDTEVTTLEPILFRRRPQLKSNERQRRWLKDDEEEIPIDIPDIDPSEVVSNDKSSFNSTIEEIKHTLLRQDLDLTNQTDEATTIVTNEEISENNRTNTEQTVESVVLTTTVNEINSTEFEITTISKNIDESQGTLTETTNQTDNVTEIVSTPVSIAETSIELELSTVPDLKQETNITLLDDTTIPPATTDVSQISTDSSIGILLENSTTIISEDVNATTVLVETQNNTNATNQEIDTTTIISEKAENQTEIIENSTMPSDAAGNRTEVTDQEIDYITTISDVAQNETLDIIDGNKDYSNETTDSPSTKPTKPICDQSCQCSRKCPYEYEIVNSTCQCNPPCANYQCFGNDTCTISKQGQPVCQPAKGSAHDRPLQCYQPRNDGYHDDGILYYDRWYYNPDEDECHSFIYRGLGGNDNNFLSLHKCRLECITCAPSPSPGACQAHISMWYYDYKKNQCSQFHYTGCKGNENRFLRKQDCVDTCITRILNI